jgi:uncharacterized protein YjiK
LTIAHIFKFYFFFLFINGCDSDEFLKGFPYDLLNPDATYVLPSDLKEVSGLTWHENRLFLVKDEKGTVYTFDLKAEEVIARQDIAGTGDFEGIECVGDKIYILRSDSRIYSSNLNKISKEGRERIEIELDDDKNLEGFGYDPVRNMLLLSSKKVKTKKNRKLYGLQMDDLKQKPQILYEFDHVLMKKALLNNASSKTQRLALQTTFVNYSFHPSAIAFHPLTKDIYVLSHPKQQILILDHDFHIKHLIPLPTTFFPQPEGICFDPAGNLFISNEGRGGKGYILYFKKE